MQHGVCGRLAVIIGFLAALIALDSIASLAADNSEAITEVDVHVPDRTIDDLRGASLLILVRNLQETNLTLVDVGVASEAAGADLDFKYQSAIGCDAGDTRSDDELVTPCTILGSHEAIIPVDVSVQRLQQSGTGIVAFELSFQSGDAVFNNIAVAELTLGMFGESELLPLLQLPSVLVIPGATLLALLMLWWRVGARPAGMSADSFPLDATGLTFWVPAVGISCVLATGWWAFTDEHHNLLRGYGYQDIGLLLGVSAAFSMIIAVLLLAARIDATRRARSRDLSEARTASEALNKLAQARADTPLKLPIVEVHQMELILYQKLLSGNKGVVGPQLRYRYTQAAPTGLEEEINGLRRSEKLAALAKRLSRAEKDEHVVIQWASKGALQVVNENDYATTGTTRPAIDSQTT